MRWRWPRLTRVQRADLYARQLLLVLLWLGVGVVLLSRGASAEDWYAALLAGTLVTLVAATVAMRGVLALYPAPGPLPWRSLVPLFVAAGGMVVMAALVPDARAPALAVVWQCLMWPLASVRDRRIWIALVVGSTLLVLLITDRPWLVALGAGQAIFLIAAVQASLWLYGLVVELDRARGAQSALAVAEERLRFSRDVHDVLGRRLAAIAVQSELAATLAERGDARATERMLEVRGQAHEALREARELARGYRGVDLGQELAGARSLLESAGIDVRLGVPDDLPAGWQEPAAWVVREAVTNILRHSSATRVDISWGAPLLTISNDGAAAATTEPGLGLAGLRERLAPLGAELTERRSDGDFELVARLPGAAPAGVGS